MAREINLTEDDIKEMEKEVASKRSSMSSEESNFVDHLLKRAKAGYSAAGPGIGWTWTYRF